MPNITIHLIRHLKLFIRKPHIERPGDRERWAYVMGMHKKCADKALHGQA